MVVSYCSFCLVFISLFVTTYMKQRLTTVDTWPMASLWGFFAISVLWFPAMIFMTWERYRHQRSDLQSAMGWLVKTMKYVSQITDQVELERLDAMTMEMHLHEASAAFVCADRLLTTSVLMRMWGIKFAPKHSSNSYSKFDDRM